jgi:hypothetical protein
MLSERKELLENHIRKLHKQAADMYLDIIKSGKEETAEYHILKEQLSSYKFDLNIVNKLLY